MHETERQRQLPFRSQMTTTTTQTQTHTSATSRHLSNGSSSGSKGSGTPRMACEKAARRLRSTLMKAERLGVSTSELASLPSAKRIVSQRYSDWKLVVLLLLMFGGGVIVALVCTTSRGCSKLDEINLAT